MYNTVPRWSTAGNHEERGPRSIDSVLSHPLLSNEGQGTEGNISCIIAEFLLFGAIGDMI